MKNETLIPITDIVKQRVSKITKKVFKIFPNDKLNVKTKEKLTQSNPTFKFIKEFDKDQILVSDYIKSFQKPKRSSKIYMSHILGMKNIKEIVGEAKLIEYRHKIRMSYMKSKEKSLLKSQEDIPNMIHLAKNRSLLCGNESRFIDFTLNRARSLKLKAAQLH